MAFKHLLFSRTAGWLLFFLAPLAVSGCKSTEVPCSWAVQPMQIDGSAMDWSSRSLTLFEDQKLSVGIINDSANMYILLRTNDLAFIV